LLIETVGNPQMQPYGTLFWSFTVAAVRER